MASGRLGSVPPAQMPEQMMTAAGAALPATLPYVEVGQGASLPVRFSLVSRSGALWSYPYGYVGLIECPTPELLTIYCQSSEVQTIAVRGRKLDEIANLLNSQRLVLLRESDHPSYPSDDPVVREIVVNRAPKTTRTMET